MQIINRVPELVAKRFGGKDKINLTQIAKETKLAYPTVASWVKGQVVRVDYPVLLAWCIYLDCTPGDLLVIGDDK